MNLKKKGQNARHVFPVMAAASSEARAAAVHALAVTLHENFEAVRAANQADIDAGRAAGLSEALIDRLTLTPARLEGLTQDVHALAEMPDPVGDVFDERVLPNGLKIRRQRVPLGVMGVIYESRPNVTCDVSSLCFKSGNAVILRGGSEAINTNKILSDLFRKSLEKNNINKNYVQFINSKNRGFVDLMLSKMQNYIDVIVPRGGKTLVQKVQNLSKIPVIGHLEGICHTYIDNEANMKIASNIIFNSKMRNTAICGCLLYTSPSPRDRQKSRMPSSA